MTQANASGKVRRGAGLLALICFLVLAATSFISRTLIFTILK